MLRQQNFWHDRVVIALMATVLGLVVVSGLFIGLRIDISPPAAEFVYWTVGGVPQFDIQPTNRLYVLAVYAVLIGGFNIVVGHRLYQKSPWLTYITLLLTDLVLIANLIVANSLISLQ